MQEISEAFRCVHGRDGLPLAGLQNRGEFQGTPRGDWLAKYIYPLQIQCLLAVCQFLSVQIIYVFHRMYQRRCGFTLRTLDLGGEQYNMWKNDLMMIERYILRELGFAFYNIGDHPHKYILYFIKVCFSMRACSGY